MFERFISAGDLRKQEPYSSEQLARLSSDFGDAVRASNSERALQVATSLLLRGHTRESIEAFTTIGQTFPSRRGHCALNIGAACFLEGRYEEAIQWYERARAFGSDGTAVDDNIAEAKQKLVERDGVQVVRRPDRPVEYVTSLIAHASPHAGRKVLIAGSIPAEKAERVASFLPPAERAILVLDLTTFGSAKDAVVFTEHLVVTKEFDEKKVVALHDVAACDGPTGMLADKVTLTTFSGANLHLPCGGHAELMTALLRVVATCNR
ncbi:MAG: tetratricopeptide repeat protein [Sandaracinus sp.]|nr:tetratricopeptide repeat protein [Sandaracinus sp.]MCB9613210.1 tetratricopeptide repeat protein [Sandaracinus sp.]